MKFTLKYFMEIRYYRELGNKTGEILKVLKIVMSDNGDTF
jgi:hypothetical protein